MWRYRELLPVAPPEAVTLGETMTPLLDCPRLAATLGLKRLLIKDESRLPTGSFKARGMAVAVSMREKVFANLSSRAADQIQEEIELLGPMRLADVELVQEQIVEIARRLEEEGRLSIDVGGSDDVLV